MAAGPAPLAGEAVSGLPAAPATLGEGQLVQQLQAIAVQLWSVAAERSALDTTTADGAAAPVDPQTLLIGLVEQEYRERRARERLFNSELFGEPAWDMLLYLYAAQLRGDLVVTSSLARASAVPTTTALRWIALLDRAKLIERCAIKRDGRVRVQRLTRQAAAQLEQYFYRRLTSSQRGVPCPAKSDLAASVPNHAPAKRRANRADAPRRVRTCEALGSTRSGVKRDG